jgi:hypothetical protein
VDIRKSFREILEKTAVVRVPKHRIATFGNTRIKYFFTSEVLSDRSRLREGLVIAESPKIITPETFNNRFEGFGDNSEEFGKYLSDQYGPSFRGLQYRFRNEPETGRLEYMPVKALTDKVRKSLSSHDADQTVLIQGPDQAWQVALMKFIVDECLRSFADNVRELDEHGYFDTPVEYEAKQKMEVEGLFSKAKEDPAMVPLLGDRLKRYGMFREYEDRFFRLVNKAR